MLLPVAAVLLASSVFGGFVRPRYPLEAALLCFALVMLTSFRLPVFVDVDAVSRFDWERTALGAGAAVALWSAARLCSRHAPARDSAGAAGRNYLVGAAGFVVFFLLVTSASYASVVYRVAMLELPEFPDLHGADSPANTWLTLPFTTDDRRVSAFAFALAVGLIGTLLALVVQRLPARFATGAVHVAAAAVKLLVLLGLVALVIAANRPALVNPVNVTRHVYDWAVVVGSLGVMLTFGDRTCSTLWFATALGAVVAVRATEHVRSPMLWSYPSIWHEVLGAILLCAVPLGLAVGLTASRLFPRTRKPHPLRWIGTGNLAIACTLLSLDGFTWYAPSLPNKHLSHTTHCLDEVPGRPYRFPSAGLRSYVGDWRLSRYNTPQRERITHAVLYAALDDPAAEYLPVLAEIAKDDLPLYVYASYLESVDLFTVPQFYVSNSSCAIASAPLSRLQKEQPPVSVHSVRQLLEWLSRRS